MKAWMDNRGSPEVAYGYVYAGKTRIGYATDREHIHVFEANWGTPNDAELLAMRDLLVAAFPRLTLSTANLRNCPAAEQEPVQG